MTAPSVAAHPGQSQSSIGAACAPATTRTIDVHGASVVSLARGRTRSSTATCLASSCGRTTTSSRSLRSDYKLDDRQLVDDTFGSVHVAARRARGPASTTRTSSRTSPSAGAAFSDEISRDRGAARKKIEVDEHSQSGTILEALAMLRQAFEEDFLGRSRFCRRCPGSMWFPSPATLRRPRPPSQRARHPAQA